MSSENSNEHVVRVKDKDGVPVFLAEAVWNEHILLRHPEIEPHKDLIIQAIENPDVQHIDPEDERVMLYYKTVLEDVRPFRKASFIRVVVKYLYPEEYNNQRTGFISSVYFVSKVKRGGRIV